MSGDRRVDELRDRSLVRHIGLDESHRASRLVCPFGGCPTVDHVRIAPDDQRSLRRECLGQHPTAPGGDAGDQHDLSLNR